MEGSLGHFDREAWLGQLHERLALIFEGATNRHVSNITGFNCETVRRYRSSHEPSAAFLVRVSTIWDVDLNWLLGSERGNPKIKRPRVIVAERVQTPKRGVSDGPTRGRRSSKRACSVETSGKVHVECARSSMS